MELTAFRGYVACLVMSSMTLKLSLADYLWLKPFGSQLRDALYILNSYE